MITAVLEGKLDKIAFENHEVFGVSIPTNCPGVPAQILNPRNTWEDKNAYDEKETCLAGLFIKNFEKFAVGVSQEVLAATPKI
jgi:phosphoenolpyruvate carboxykinase (ATP)